MGFIPNSKARAGRHYIEREEYTLTRQDSGQLVQRASWESSMQPGMHVVMSAQIQAELRAGMEKCTNCHRAQLVTTSEGPTVGVYWYVFRMEQL